MKEVFLVKCDGNIFGVYSSYQKAVHAIMTNADFPIMDFTSQFGVDCFTDNVAKDWFIQALNVDEM